MTTNKRNKPAKDSSNKSKIGPKASQKGPSKRNTAQDSTSRKGAAKKDSSQKSASESISDNAIKREVQQEIQKEEIQKKEIGSTNAQSDVVEDIKSADKKNTAPESSTSITNQLGDTKEKMATSNSNPEKTEAKKANKTTESIAAPAPVQKTGSGGATVLAVFAIILTCGGGYWIWDQMNIERQNSASTIAALQQQLESQLAKSQQAIASSQDALRNEINQTKSEIKASASETQQSISTELTTKSMAIESMAKLIESSTAAKISAAESNLTTAQAELGKANLNIKETQKRQASLETSLEAVYARIGNTSREWVIAEADFLLQIANHRLQLERDVTTSMQALALADKRINSLSDPALNEVRNVIAQELMALQTLPVPDQAAVSNQLAALQDQVDQLPLAARTQPTHTKVADFKADDAMEVESWQVLPVAILDVLKGMVSVNYNDKPLEPLLSPEQVRNLHENLKLKLEQARIVSLRGDAELYAANLDLAINWTNKHFNGEEVSTKKFIEALNHLKTKQIVLKTPDITRSLNILRSVAKRLDMNLPSMNNNASNEISDTNNLVSN